MGRFIFEDTNKGKLDNPSTLNLYTYCQGNPIRYVDPNGHESWDTADALYIFKGVMYFTVYSYAETQMFLARASIAYASAIDKVQAGIDAAKDKMSGGNNNSSSDPDPNKFDKGKGSNNIEFKKYSPQQIEKIYNLNKNQFHKEVKQDILKALADKNSQYKSLLNKMGIIQISTYQKMV